jgi:hypothetical protein
MPQEPIDDLRILDAGDDPQSKRPMHGRPALYDAMFMSFETTFMSFDTMFISLPIRSERMI